MRLYLVTFLLLSQFLLQQPETSYAQETATANPIAELISAETNQTQSVITRLIQQNPNLGHWVKQAQQPSAAKITKERKVKLVAGWSQWEATDSLGVTRPYQVYLPKSVAEGKPVAAVICHIHGAVGRNDFGQGLGSPSACGYAPFIWPKVADKENFVIVCPQGRKDCSWWTDAGVRHIRATVRDLRRSVQIPANSIFCSGFSDGGSGCYYMAMTGPDPFAGFIALNGNPIVASKASGKQIYLHNMSVTPLFAGMTHKDSLYPSAMILPHLTKAIELGADATVVAYPKMNHQPSYFKVQTDAIVDFIKKNPLPPHKNQIRWVASDKNIAKTDWLEILDFGKTQTDAQNLPTGNVMSPKGAVKTGIRFARGEKEGKIARVTKGSAAEVAGIKPGDTLVSLSTASTSTMQIKDSKTLRKRMQMFEWGDVIGCVIKRDGKEIKLQLKTKPFVSQPIYDRTNPTSFADCTIYDGESKSIRLRSAGVKRLRIWLPNSFEEAKEIEVTRVSKAVNQSASYPIKKLSTEEFLRKISTSGDPSSVRHLYVELTLE